MGVYCKVVRMASGDLYTGDRMRGSAEDTESLVASVDYSRVSTVFVTVEGRKVALNPRHVESVQWMPVP